MKAHIVRKLTAVVLSLTLVMSTCAVTAFAGTKSSGSAPKIEKVKYDYKGKVEVDFYGKVRYKKAKVTLKDSSGNTYTAKILDKDNDEIEFRVNKYKYNTKYTFQISGVKKSKAKSYTTVKGSFSIPPKGAIIVKKAKYDRDDRELSIDFKTPVSWKKAKAEITDTSGKVYKARITDKDKDEIEIRISGLKSNSTYNYKISGIRAKDGGSYTTISGKFKVPASTKITIDDIEYDAGDREVSFSFKNKVQWKSPKVTIKNSKGTAIKTRILDKDNDEIEVKANLSKGKKYSYSISGIKAKGSSSYKTIKGTFKAVDD